MKNLLPTALVIASLSLFSCTAGQNPELAPPPAPQLAAELLGQLPALPQERQATGLSESQLDGSATYDKAVSAISNAPALELSAAGGELCWGMWELPAVNEPRYLAVNLDVTEGDQAYLALADYASGSWEFSGPYLTSTMLLLDPARHRSPGDMVYVLAAVYDGHSASVLRLTLIVSSLNTAPTAALGAIPQAGIEPLEVQFDASGSFDSDEDDAIVRYYWDFEGGGDIDRITFTPSTRFTYANAGIFGATVYAEDMANERGTASVAINVNAQGNTLPVAELQASPASGDAPLDVSFDASTSTDADGSLVRFDYDFDSDGAWDAYDAADGLSHTYASPGLYDATLRVTDNSGAQDLVTIPIEALAVGNEPPFADLQISGASFGYVPFTATLDASASNAGGDPGDSIVEYEWDWDGNGAYEESGTDALIEHVYTICGNYQVKLRITDSAGNQATGSATINAYVAPVIIDSTGSQSNGNAMLAVFGLPAVAYYSADDDELRYTRAMDDSGTAWNTAVVVDTTDNVGLYVSMQIINSNPAVLYYDSTNLQFKYARASNLLGSAWNAPVVVAPTPIGSQGDPALGVADGNPCAVFDENGAVYFVRATDINGTTWGAPQLIETIGAFTRPRLASVNGNPAVCFWDSADEELHYVRSTVADGSSWGTPLVLDTTTATGFGMSMSLVDGKPAIAYASQTPKELRFVRALDADGSTWGSPVVVIGSADNGGGHCSLCVVNGNPAIACIGGVQNYTTYVRANDKQGTTWAPPQTLDPANFTGYYAQLAVINGRPAICSRENSTGGVRYYWGF